MLEVAGLAAGYGDKAVVHDVTLAVGAREIVALIGHNGAGKTTVLRTVAGLLPARSGRVTFDGREVRAGDTAALARAGLAFVPQGRNTFPDLTVAENLDIATARREDGRIVSLADIHGLFPPLAERGSAQASTLSGGQRQMLALACALLRQPRLVMLDEPSTGLAPVLVEDVFAMVALLRDQFGLGVLVVDQNARRLMALADRVIVLKAGEVVFSGSPAGLARDEDLWRLF
jgi:branched-chain amino acid transport system ATP-binding protein